MDVGGTAVQSGHKPSDANGFDPYRFLYRCVPTGTDRYGPVRLRSGCRSTVDPMSPSPRQAPVVAALAALLEQAAACAAALGDNAAEDGYPLAADAVLTLRRQLNQIDRFVLAASSTSACTTP